MDVAVSAARVAKSKRKNARQAAAKDAEKDLYILGIQSDESYERLVRLLGGDWQRNVGSDAGAHALELLDEVFSICWVHCKRLVDAARTPARGQVDLSALKAAKAEVETLREQLVESNKASLKQLNTLNASISHDDPMDFYEPFQYISQSNRDLMIEMLAYKMWQIENGRAPPSLLNQVRSKMKEFDDADDDAEMSPSALRKQLEQLEREKASMAAQMNTQMAELQRSNEALRTQEREMQQRLRASEEEKEAAIAQAKTASSEAQGARCHRGHPVAEDECPEGEVRHCDECNRRMQAGESCFNCGPCAATFCEKCVVRGGNMRSKQSRHVQTDMDGDTLSKLSAENKRLKVMLEEVKAKLGDLVRKGAAKGIGSELDQLAEEVGLKPFLRCGGVFEKLYQDAFDRVKRIEKLRERLRQERQGAIGDVIREYTQKSVPLPPNILEAVEQSKLCDHVLAITALGPDDPARSKVVLQSAETGKAQGVHSKDRQHSGVGKKLAGFPLDITVPRRAFDAVSYEPKATKESKASQMGNKTTSLPELGSRAQRPAVRDDRNALIINALEQRAKKGGNGGGRFLMPPRSMDLRSACPL